MSDNPLQYILNKEEWDYFRSCEQQLAASLAAIKIKAEALQGGRFERLALLPEALAATPDDALSAVVERAKEQCAAACMELQNKTISGGSPGAFFKRKAEPKDCAEAIRALEIKL